MLILQPNSRQNEDCLCLCSLGRVIQDNGTDQATAVPGLYTVGWVKRGPTGIIGRPLTRHLHFYISDSKLCLEGLACLHRQPSAGRHECSIHFILGRFKFTCFPHDQHESSSCIQGLKPMTGG